MRKQSRFAVMILLAAAVFSTPSRAETGRVYVGVGKAALILGAATGRGVLSYGGRNYRFRMSGLSLGLAAGISTTRLAGEASNLRDVRDFAGIYTAAGLGGAWVLGAAEVRLKNQNGVVITLHGMRAGIELAANIAGISIELE